MQSYREPSIGMVRSTVQQMMHLAMGLQPRSSKAVPFAFAAFFQGCVPAPGGISEPLASTV